MESRRLNLIGTDLLASKIRIRGCNRSYLLSPTPTSGSYSHHSCACTTPYLAFLDNCIAKITGAPKGQNQLYLCLVIMLKKLAGLFFLAVIRVPCNFPLLLG